MLLKGEALPALFHNKGGDAPGADAGGGDGEHHIGAGLAAQALGTAQGAYEAAVEYSKERVQFGKPICQQQNIAFKIADMAGVVTANTT